MTERARPFAASADDARTGLAPRPSPHTRAAGVTRRRRCWDSAAQPIRRVLLVLAVTAMAVPAVAASCPRLPQPAIEAAGLAEALRRSDGVRIIAFGSSSTEGSGASDAAHTYPALLQARLRAALGPQVSVLNHGKGGEDAHNMIDRITRDAIADRPDLVIWQVGANATMRRMDTAAFRAFVEQGIRMLRQAGIEVVLMDNQRAPRIAAFPGNRRFDAILAEIAAATPGVTLFSRGTLMDGWAAAGVPPEALLISDGLHHNDRGYACVADALADALLAGMPIRAVRAP